MSNGLLVLTEDWSKPDPWQNKAYKTINIVDLKMLAINFKGWYCPIDTEVFTINPDGTINSGICKNVVHTTIKEPWWSLTELKINSNSNHACIFKDNSCSCDSDLYVTKAINKDTWEWFVNNKPKDNTKLLEITKEDKIIAMERRTESSQEIHFSIGKRCNFNCSYCPPEEVHDNYSPDILMSVYKRTLGLLEPYTRENKKLFITGGEPTLNPNLLNMVKYALEDLNYPYLVINTNGTATLPNMIRLLQHSHKISLYISLHPEFTKEILIKKVAKLLTNIDNPNQILVKVMAQKNSKLGLQARSIIPDWFNIHYYPIYGIDLSKTSYDNIKTQTYAEMKKHANEKI